MIHPHTELRFISPEVGHGVVATQFIPKGTITWVLDALDRTFTQEEVTQMEPLYKDIIDTYCYRNNLGNLVLCWDMGRFVNHSFDSNCLSTAYDFEIAIRDIHPGEQLTDDYGYLNIDAPFQGIDEGTDRKIVYPDDILKFHSVWDAKISEAFTSINILEQPLRPVLRSQTRTTIDNVIAGKEKLASIKELYYKP